MIKREFTINDFYGMEVTRDNGVAELIVDEFKGRPVRLIGFYRDVSLSDLQVREQGYLYYKELVGEVKKV